MYQRKFAWGQEQINDFLDEIKALFDKEFIKKVDYNLAQIGDDGHFVIQKNIKNIFFGTIYLTSLKQKKKHSFREVIDGQQRITTWYLFLLASYNLLNIYKEKYKYRENNASEYGERYRKLYFDNIRKWLFYSSRNQNFEPKYKNLKYKTLQKDDEEDWKILFDILFTKEYDDCLISNDVDMLGFDTEKKVEKILFIRKNKHGVGNLRRTYNSKIFKAYIQIEKFLLKLIEKLSVEKVISDHKYILMPEVNNEFGEKHHKTFVVIYWLIFKIIPNFEFAIFELTNDEKAPQIFETINGKGLQLSAFDIIKNKIYDWYNKQDINKFEGNITKLEEKIIVCYGDLKNADSFWTHKVFLGGKRFE